MIYNFKNDTLFFNRYLATAISFALQPQIIDNAEQRGQKLRKENGVITMFSM